MTVAKFKKDQGPKSIFEMINSILTSDTDLKGLVKYTPQNVNIRRALQPSGNWELLVIYYLQPEYPIQDFSANIRQAPLIVKCFGRDNDLDIIDIGERIIQLLHGADLSKKGYCHVFDCSYTGELGSLVYDDTLKAYVRTLRFLVTYRKEEE